VRRLTNIVPVVLCAWLALAGAAVAGVPGCANPADSALNQYCDSVPTSVGPKPPWAGSPSLATSLPQRVRRLLWASAERRRLAALTTLPAPVTPARVTVPAPSASLWSLALWMILLLAAIALGVVAAAAARNRLRRPRAV
jgi:hypothetical protein